MFEKVLIANRGEIALRVIRACKELGIRTLAVYSDADVDSSDVIQKMGDKDMARACARKAGVPITPGSDGVVQSDKDAVKLARKLGYPVMIKAVAGGGGRGMRAAHNETSLVAGFHSARLEAEKA